MKNNGSNFMDYAVCVKAVIRTRVEANSIYWPLPIASYSDREVCVYSGKVDRFVI